ncbi:muscle-specific protein 300 kDa-like isoform X2 [Eriocheir sinensis]|uniref:muscle-specific protein 300 kDa-like isoform X2 n=1 Tax=Eriocheir sinensis TaxID=95602 RepID=UPI0021C77BDD|nr:muscle-specific protein 300 kDa-like isoform X2 [Eriocheir sinensis]
MQQVSEAYKKDIDLSKAESDGIAKFLLEINERWKNVSVELRCIQSLLEEVIAYWKKFLDLTGQFEAWLDRSFPMVKLPEEEKMNYFQDLGEWKERHDEMEETGNFLAATCRPEVAQEIREKLFFINKKWEDLFQYVQQYLHQGQIIRTKNDYCSGQDRLEQWIQNAETLLSTTNVCTVEAIREYGEKLKKLNTEIDDMELLFKTISKAFQSLVQDLTPDEIERMMWSLKQEKEELVRCRAVIPQKMYLTTQIITQLEAVESGIIEINQWLDEGEALLNSFIVHGTNESMQQQHNKQKV